MGERTGPTGDGWQHRSAGDVGTHRCTRMAEHCRCIGEHADWCTASQCACHPRIPVPCSECYWLESWTREVHEMPQAIADALSRISIVEGDSHG